MSDVGFVITLAILIFIVELIAARSYRTTQWLFVAAVLRFGTLTGAIFIPVDILTNRLDFNSWRVLAAIAATALLWVMGDVAVARGRDGDRK